MTAQFRQRIDTTYADLRPSDLVIDKSGQAWPLDDEIETSLDGASTIFWLCDPMTKIRLHNLSKPANDPVKVSRLPTQAAEASKLEAEFPEHVTTVFSQETIDNTTSEARRAAEYSGQSAETMQAAMDVIAEQLGGSVEAEVTAAEVDAAAAATDDAPLTIIPFADMTPLEQRSHLFLCHGVYGHDLQGKAELAALHDQAHAATGTLNSRHVPHVHEVTA